MRQTAIGAAMFLAVAAWSGAACAGSRDVTDQTRLFLDAYARGDQAAVLGMVEPTITVYGSDVAEIAHGPAGVSKMMAADNQLWGSSASIGAMDHVAMVKSGSLAALTFDAPFTVGGRPPVTVRFSLVWRRSGTTWRLAQSANATPTVGQTAADLLKPQ